MKKMMLAVLVLALAAVSGFSKGEQTSWESLKQVRAGEKIEVVEMSLKSTRGAFVSVSDEAIVLRVKGDNVTVERASVMRVTVRDTSKRSRNMLLGAAIGAGAGLTLGLLANAPGSNEGNDNPGMIAGVTAGAAGAGLGMGAVTGNRTVYRAEKVSGRPASH